LHDQDSRGKGRRKREAKGKRRKDRRADTSTCVPEIFVPFYVLGANKHFCLFKEKQFYPPARSIPSSQLT
jgi:hypothetical protein